MYCLVFTGKWDSWAVGQLDSDSVGQLFSEAVGSGAVDQWSHSQGFQVNNF